MKSIFSALTRPIAERIRYRDDVRREFGNIRGDKVATLIDLVACFNEASKPRGILGKEFAACAPHVFSNISILHQMGHFPVHDLPASLAYGKTRERIDETAKLIDESNRRSEKFFRELFDMPETDGKLVYIGMPAPERIAAMYLGDFIEVTNMTFGFEKDLNLACYLGYGAETLDIVKDLRNVPDYSSHFPPRPPRNGKGKKNEEPDRPVPVGQLNPI